MKRPPAPWGPRNRAPQKRSRRLTLALSAALIITAALVGSAGAQVGTASLAVEVESQEAGLLSGVAVEVVNSETGLRREVRTDDHGNALILALPPGSYEVTATLEDMASPAKSGVTLRVGNRARVRLVLYPQITEAMAITGERPLVDAYRTDSSVSIVPEQIDSLPVADRQFEKLAFLAPGVQRDRIPYFDRTGAPVIGAAGNSHVATVLVDGVDFSDPWTGQSRLRLSQDSIREFRVVGQGFDSEVGGTAAGGLSIVTKRGTNELRASAFAFARDKSLRAKPALALEKADYSRYHAGFTLGGPVARNRTHFFAAFEHLSEDDVAQVRPGGAFAHLAADVIQPRDQTTVLLSLDHAFTGGASGIARLHWERYRRDNYEVGGIIDESAGWSWDRDAWTLVVGNTWVIGAEQLNELRVQIGERDAAFPVNTTEMGEWFSSASTLRTGSSTLENEGPLRGEFYGLRDTHHWHLGGGRHHLKAGFEYQHLDSFYREDRFVNGLMVYLDDYRLLPWVYIYGTGSSASHLRSDLYGLFAQDEWRVRENLTVNVGLRYDLDTDGNLPDLRHPLTPDGREVDDDNLQPRVGFAWDLGGNGRTVVRGGLGRFVGRYNQYWTHEGEQFNEVTGRTRHTRLSLYESGLIIDPANPLTTGWPLPPDITLLAADYPLPESNQARLGLSHRLGSSRLHLEIEGVYAEGKNEHVIRNTNWAGNDDPRPISTAYSEVLTHTREGRSRYEALSLGLRGSLRNGHLITASLVLAEKMNILDEIQRPSDPADIEAEWGRSGTGQKYRFVSSGVFRLPWAVTLSAIYEYGSGQPWNRTLGYDYNGDIWASDRAPAVARNDQDGPRFSQLDLLAAKAFDLGDRGSLEVVAEVFNLLDTVNFDVTSVDDAMYFAGPTLMGPSREHVPNPGFGAYRDTHRPREVQVGVRYRF